LFAPTVTIDSDQHKIVQIVESVWAKVIVIFAKFGLRWKYIIVMIVVSAVLAKQKKFFTVILVMRVLELKVATIIVVPKCN
jgi:hypothetical protein